MRALVTPKPVRFADEKGGIVWRNAGLALGITALEIALLVFAWQAREASTARQAAALPLTELVEVPLDPPPPPPPAPRMADPAPEGGSMSPSTPPVVRPFVPEPAVTITELRVPVTPIAPDIPAPDRGRGTSTMADGGTIGAGNGLGNGLGDGDGNGPGTGNAAGRREPPRRLTTTWAPGFRMSQLRRYYPSDARRQRITGRARLDCLVVENDFVTDCRLMREWPAGHGFGEAALQAQDVYRIRVHDQFDRRVYNERIIVNAEFE